MDASLRERKERSIGSFMKVIAKEGEHSEASRNSFKRTEHEEKASKTESRASRPRHIGNILACTGVHGAGTSTIACNIAYTLGKLGYRTLLIDFDLMERSQNYLTRDSIEALDIESNNIIKALSSKGTDLYDSISFVRKNVYLLGAGIACEPLNISQLDQINNMVMILNILQKGYDFLVYDIPIKSLVEDVNFILDDCDSLILNIDSSSWGIVNAINYLCNIDDEYTLSRIFQPRTKILYNKFRGPIGLYDIDIDLKSCMSSEERTDGCDVDDKKTASPNKLIDEVVSRIAGYDIGYHFEDMGIAGVIELDVGFEGYVGNSVQYCDTEVGRLNMLSILRKAVGNDI